MENVWVLASLWVGLALVATLLAIWLKISTALSEIVVGTVAQLVIGAFVIQGGLGAGRWDFVPCRNRSNFFHLPSGCRTRSRDISYEVEGSHGGWSGWVLRPVPRLHSNRPLQLGMGSTSLLAGGSGSFYYVGSRGLRGYARTRLQYD